MTRNPELLLGLAGLLGYPRADWPERLRVAQAAVAGTAADEAVAGFAAAVAGQSPEDLAELYTQTFDLNPVCALDVGWHLFGEDYQRGLLLVRLRGELARCGLAENGELPDHLSHVLPLLAALPEVEAAGLARAVVRPALAVMLEGFSDEANPYRPLLLAVAGAVAACCPDAEVAHA